jgi:hypothetical protein
MKNLPCILSFSAIFSLLALTVLSALGVSMPFDRIASDVLGISCGVSVLGFLLADYGPRGMPDYRAAPALAPKRVVAPAASRRVGHSFYPGYDDAITVNLMSSLELRNDPSTVSLM